MKTVCNKKREWMRKFTYRDLWSITERHTLWQYSLQSPLGWHPGISHFHSPHQPARCQGKAWTGSDKRAARGNGECCWSGRQWRCTPGAHAPPPDRPHQHGSRVRREETAQRPRVLRVLPDCHRQRGRLERGGGGSMMRQRVLWPSEEAQL